MGLPILPVMLFLSIAAISLFSFVAVAAWSESRRKEREAFYRSETVKKLAEMAGPGSNAALEYMREQEQISTRRRLEGIRLGGLVTAAVGVSLMIFLAGVEHRERAYLVGLIPLFIGSTLFAYVQFLAPKP